MNRYFIETWQRLFQGYFKSCRIVFRVALWLDFEQLSNYSFMYRRLFGVAVWKCYMEFYTNWRIQSRDISIKLTTGYLKIISRHIEWFLGRHYGLILNNYPVTYSFSGSYSSYGSKMLHGIWYKLEDWIKIYLIQTYHTLSQEYFKSYRIAFRVALWLDFGQISSYLFVYWRLFLVTISKFYMEFDTNWRIESRDMLSKLTTDYLKSISSH